MRACACGASEMVPGLFFFDPGPKKVPISRGGARSPYGRESYALIFLIFSSTLPNSEFSPLQIYAIPEFFHRVDLFAAKVAEIRGRQVYTARGNLKGGSEDTHKEDPPFRG